MSEKLRLLKENLSLKRAIKFRTPRPSLINVVSYKKEVYYILYNDLKHYNKRQKDHISKIFQMEGQSHRPT